MFKKIYSLCKETNVEVSFINNENDFKIEFSRIDRNKSGEINGEISKDEIAVLNALKDNHRAIKEDIKIKNLKSKGFIKRIGSNKTGYWEVLK